jgi:osmotically-inducible protein OsmY
MNSDAEIRRLVEDELNFDPTVNATDIGVSGKDGVVTLTGFVHTFNEKIQAEKAAKRVGGVAGIANDIQVRLRNVDAQPDPEIARAAVHQLKLGVPLSYDKLKVSVESGWVTLEGQLQWNYERVDAEAAVRRLRCVRGIFNLIELTPRADASNIKQLVTNALQRSARIDASHITVETNGSRAILTGAVRSWAEREEAEEAAWMAAGVTAVDDRIVVRG